LTHRIIRKAKYGADKFVLAGLYKVHYVEAGKGEPVILIPGSFSTYRVWNRLMPILSKDYQLLALDYLGVGDPDKPRKGFDNAVQEQTDIIAQAIKVLNLGKVTLIGRSYSGAIAFDFAARYPDFTKKIVSIEGGVVKPENTNPKSASRVPWYKISVARKTSKGLEETAKSIKTPILYLYGTKSNKQEILLGKNLEYFKNYLPQTWIVALEGGIHELTMQNPSEVAGLILDFLKARE
jgi:pimeloyl-ACP methyl ester carboxylesterase